MTENQKDMVANGVATCSCTDDARCAQCVEEDITDRLEQWRLHGRRGLSSDAIADAVFKDYTSIENFHYPLDPDDLRRCLLLLEEVPEAWEFGVLPLATISKEWLALVRVWDILELTLKWEIGGGLELLNGEHPLAHKTYRIMKGAIGFPHHFLYSTDIYVEFGNHRVVRRQSAIEHGPSIEGIGPCFGAHLTRSYIGDWCDGCGNLITWVRAALGKCTEKDCDCVECVPYTCDLIKPATGKECKRCAVCTTCIQPRSAHSEDGDHQWMCEHDCGCECEGNDEYCDCNACDEDGCQCSMVRDTPTCDDEACTGNKLFVNGELVASQFGIMNYNPRKDSKDDPVNGDTLTRDPVVHIQLGGGGLHAG